MAPALALGIQPRALSHSSPLSPLIVYRPELSRRPSRDARTLTGRFRKSGLLTLVDGLPPNVLTVVIVGLLSHGHRHVWLHRPEDELYVRSSDTRASPN